MLVARGWSGVPSPLRLRATSHRPRASFCPCQRRAFFSMRGANSIDEAVCEPLLRGRRGAMREARCGWSSRWHRTLTAHVVGALPDRSASAGRRGQGRSSARWSSPATSKRRTWSGTHRSTSCSSSRTATPCVCGSTTTGCRTASSSTASTSRSSNARSSSALPRRVRRLLRHRADGPADTDRRATTTSSAVPSLATIRASSTRRGILASRHLQSLHSRHSVGHQVREHAARGVHRSQAGERAGELPHRPPAGDLGRERPVPHHGHLEPARYHLALPARVVGQHPRPAVARQGPVGHR